MHYNSCAEKQKTKRELVISTHFRNYITVTIGLLLNQQIFYEQMGIVH